MSTTLNYNSLPEADEAQLRTTALRVREHIIRMATGGGCFIGASLSCADLIVYLYGRHLRVAPSRLDDPNRDYLFLSKGHDVPALYGTLAELGYIDRDRLAAHLSPNDAIYWHPNRRIPGVEFHSGSLGHLLSVAIGVALDIKMRGTDNRVYVIMGDGELNEGSIWEGLLVANAYGLDNLVGIVDRNEFQANIRTEELIPLEPLASKFEAFGWSTERINGHSFQEMEGAFGSLPFESGRPSMIIADTVRGRGCPSIEWRADRWFMRLGEEDADLLMRELHGGEGGTLAAEPLVVR
ncbi:MAG: transketolase [Bacteroidetes bacterium]|nr:transketolase [Bacteroidota bacterium]